MLSPWLHRVAIGCAAVVVCVGALVVPVARAERPGGMRAGGNGVRHFYGFDGYADSSDGCSDFGDNPNVKPGREHTSTIVGHIWLDEGGKLRTEGDGIGELKRDGSFHLDFPRVGPAALRRIEGRIGAPKPDGLSAPVTGGWTVPYPNGTSRCLVHFVITDGYVDLERGFGIPLTAEKPSKDSGLPLLPLGAGLVALGALGGLLVWRKPWKPRCRCACTATIVGDHELYVGDPATTWRLEPSQGGKGALDTWLVATVPDGERPAKTLRRLYAVQPSEKCAGGGRIVYWGAEWKLGETTAEQVALDVVVTAGTSCADGTTGTITCGASCKIALRRHCGPDITDQFVRGLNLTLKRLRVRADKARRMGDDIRDQAIDFLASNGGWIAFRPFSQAYEKGEPPYSHPGKCPSCRGCGATVTFLGTCIDNFIIDGYLYGVVCGFLGVSATTMTAAGLATKWLDSGVLKALFGGHHLNPDTWNGALPNWQRGHAAGAHAWATPSFTFSSGDTWLTRLAVASPHRADCLPCSDVVPINGPDWPSMDWEKPTTKLDPF